MKTFIKSWVEFGKTMLNHVVKVVLVVWSQRDSLLRELKRKFTDESKSSDSGK